MARRTYDPDSLEEAFAIMDECADEDRRVFELASLDPRIEEMPLRTLRTLRAESRVSEAIDEMVVHRVGAVGVVSESDGQLIGLFTERDVVVRVAAKGLDPKHTRLSDVMTAQPDSLRVDDTLASLAYEMQVHGFCNVPIVDEQGETRHLVSLRDVLAFLLRPVEARISTMPPAPYHGEVHLDVEYG
jgi:CBS domain-containing protein